MGDTKPYDDIIFNKWMEWEDSAKIQYITKQQLTFRNIEQIIITINPSYIYLNSMFSRFFTIYPLLINWKKQKKVKIILAPRGMLQESALAIKKVKKSIFLALCKSINLFDIITFHATSVAESIAIKKYTSTKNPIKIVSNLPKVIPSNYQKIQKQKEVLSCICVARIHPIKGIHFFLDLVKDFKFQLTISIIGPMEDLKYWKECQLIIKKLPQNISVQYHGEKAPHKIQSYLDKAHLFVLPTQGENFGHSIFEAFSSGRPALIANTTPWRNLINKKAGWDLNLKDIFLWKKTLNIITEMEQTEYGEWSNGAFKLANSFYYNSNLKKKYLDLFS